MMPARIASLTGTFTATLFLALGGFTPAAEATFSGQNGQLVFASETLPELLQTASGDVTTLDPQTLHRQTIALGLSPKWAPDGKTIAFTSVADSASTIMIRDSSGAIRTLATPNYNAGLGSWAPDGNSLAFEARPTSTGIGGRSTLFTIPATGGPFRLLESQPLDARLVQPEWSPDGTRIAFATSIKKFTRGRIYIAAADGSGIRAVSSGANDVSPSWSPDGTQIAFSHRSARTGGIYAANADGSKTRRLTRAEDGTPAWSPDGRQIAFTRFEAKHKRKAKGRKKNATFRMNVLLMNADGSDLRKLFSGRQLDLILSLDWGRKAAG